MSPLWCATAALHLAASAYVAYAYQRPARRIRPGEITRLALNAHGAPGVVFLDGGEDTHDARETGTYRAGTVTHFRQVSLDLGGTDPWEFLLEDVLRYTADQATILFMACNAGESTAGNLLLERLSRRWPGRTFVAFTVPGAQSPGFQGDAPGMLDTDIVDESVLVQPGITRPLPPDYTTRVTRPEERARLGIRAAAPPTLRYCDVFPWASETSPHAKVYVNGRCMRAPQESTGAPPAPQPPASEPSRPQRPRQRRHHR